ncbi:MAG: N-acetyltransferase [Bacilli bacterium]|nr:N-acetyltransferase [Bacilli bacterium]
MKIYERIPTFENNRLIIREVLESDIKDLTKVYGDRLALPFFNSDNCKGDIFYYHTLKKMKDALSFWDYSYRNRYFVRLSIFDKKIKKTIGTIEICMRVSKDDYNNVIMFRLDVASKYEQVALLKEIIDLIVPHIPNETGLKQIVTKIPLYAVERTKAFKNYGFKPTDTYLVGEDGYPYKDYWMITIE